MHTSIYGTHTESSHSFGKSYISSTITVEISEEELSRDKNIISLMIMGQIQVILKVGDDSKSLDPSQVKNLDNSTLPIARSDGAIFARITSESPWILNIF